MWRVKGDKLELQIWVQNVYLPEKAMCHNSKTEGKNNVKNVKPFSNKKLQRFNKRRQPSFVISYH